MAPAEKTRLPGGGGCEIMSHRPAVAGPKGPKMSRDKFKRAIESAQAEVATWTEEKRLSVQLEGADIYLERAKQAQQAPDRSKPAKKSSKKRP